MIFKTAIRAEKISLKTLFFFGKMLDKAFWLCYYNKALKISSRGVAQLVAHVVWDHGVGSSSLFTPTNITEGYGPLAQLVRAAGS